MGGGLVVAPWIRHGSSASRARARATTPSRGNRGSAARSTSLQRAFSLMKFAPVRRDRLSPGAQLRAGSGGGTGSGRLGVRLLDGLQLPVPYAVDLLVARPGRLGVAAVGAAA